MGAMDSCAGAPSMAARGFSSASDCRRRGGLRPLRAATLRPVLLAIATTLALLPRPAQGAYFKVEEGKQRCFSKPIRQHEVLRIEYSMNDKEVLQAESEKKSECKVFVKDSNEKVIKEHALGEDHHKDVLVVVPARDHEGDHHICLECASDKWFGKRSMRWTLSFEVLGDLESPGQQPDTARLATLAKFKSSVVGVDDLVSRTIAIETENAYEKRFEEKFTRASEAVNMDVAAFKVLQIVLVAGVTAYQLHNMVKFLRSSQVCACLPMRGKAPAP